MQWKIECCFWNIIDKCNFSLIVDRNWCVLFLTYWPTNRKGRLVLLPKSTICILYFLMLVRIKTGKWALYNSSTASENCDRNKKSSSIIYLWKNDNKWQIRNIHIKYKIIIIIQYTISWDVDFVLQSHENDNKINIDNSPSKFWL